MEKFVIEFIKPVILVSSLLSVIVIALYFKVAGNPIKKKKNKEKSKLNISKFNSYLKGGDVTQVMGEIIKFYEGHESHVDRMMSRLINSPITEEEKHKLSADIISRYGKKLVEFDERFRYINNPEEGLSVSGYTSNYKETDKSLEILTKDIIDYIEEQENILVRGAKIRIVDSLSITEKANLVSTEKEPIISAD